MKIAPRVAKPVRLTDNAALAFAIELMKFEMFPPGHEATKIIPKATEGLGFNIKIKRKLRRGSNTNCETIPVTTDLGFLIMALNSSMRMSSATPNMIKAKAMLRKNKPEGEKFNLT